MNNLIWEERKEDVIYKKIAKLHGEEKADQVLKLANAWTNTGIVEGWKAVAMACEVLLQIELSKETIERLSKQDDPLAELSSQIG